jgi:hypothetical protein
MAFDVSNFRSKLISDGARPNLFEVNITLPTAGGVPSLGDKLTFMAKSAQLPGSTIGTANLYYFGREMKFPGNRTFADWTITVINDEGFEIRRAFEVWMSNISSHTTNMRNTDFVNNTGYSKDGKVIQYSKSGDTLQTYDFKGMFPIDISPIELDWGTNDSIEEFSITFAYQYWTVSTTTAVA